MPMDDANQYHSFLEALNLGSFPRNISNFKDSGSYFNQIIFVDHELQTTLQSVSPESLYLVANPDDQERIRQLINYTHTLNSVHSNTQKSYLEVYYASVVLAHLQVLIQDYESAILTLDGFRIDHSVVLKTLAEQDFLDYIAARFHSLLGKASSNGPAVWSVFLKSLKRYGRVSQVSANIWINSIFGHVISTLSFDGKSPLQFKNLYDQGLAKNICSFTSLANYALRQENSRFIDSSFKQDYLKFITGLFNDKIKQKKEFPNANDKDSSEIDFVQSFYQTLNDVSRHRNVITHFLKPNVSKDLLISMSENTYQNHSVLSNLILSLIDLGEYDEAFAAFKTYISYVEKEKIQTGNVPDLLQVISLYSLCIRSFNPSASFITDAKSSSKKFRYNTLDSVLPELAKFSKDLQVYLEQVAEYADLSYNIEGNDQDALSFLYYRFNPQVYLSTSSILVRTLSDGWFSLGQFYQYLSTYNSINSESLKENISDVTIFFKNCLIINSSGDLEYLFNYALVLAYDNQISASAKLCKFILKKFPESFKTWNLLALATSALENEHFTKKQEASKTQTNISQNDSSEFSSPNVKSVRVNDSERFIDDSLNIAGIHISKQHDRKIPLSIQTKYEILQLKMTQLAIWEAKHGVQSILEFITDIFVLYRELFSHVQFPTAKNNDASRSNGKWSNRPSVTDPSEIENNPKSTSASRFTGKDSIRRLSKISLDSTDGRHHKWHHKTHREENDTKQEHEYELRILQEIWLWTASIYLKLGYFEEAEQCIIEAETADKPNAKTHTYLGLLTSKTRKHLALQELERSFEILHSKEEKFNRKTYGLTLVGLSQLFIAKDGNNDSLFVSEKDRDAALVRLKNYLEAHSNCWPYGYNSPELWYYLSAIYEEFDDRVLQSEALWRCIDLETGRPVRSYEICEKFSL